MSLNNNYRCDNATENNNLSSFQSFIRKSLECAQNGISKQPAGLLKTSSIQNELGNYCENRRSSLLREEKKDLKRGERKKERQSDRGETGVRDSTASATTTSISKNETARTSYNCESHHQNIPSCLETLKALNVTSPNKRVPSKDSLTSKQSAQIDQTLSNYLETLKSKRNNIKSSSFLKKFVSSNSQTVGGAGSINNNTGSQATADTTNLPDSHSNTSGTAYSLSDMMKRFLQESSESKTPSNPKRYAQQPGVMGLISDYSSVYGSNSNNGDLNVISSEYSGYKSVNAAASSNNLMRSSDSRSPKIQNAYSYAQKSASYYEVEEGEQVNRKQGNSTGTMRNSTKYLQVNTDFPSTGGVKSKETLGQKNSSLGEAFGSESIIPLDNLALLQKGFHDIYKRECVRKTDFKHIEIEENKARSVPATTRHSTSGSNPLANIFLNYSSKSPTKIADLDSSPNKSPVISSCDSGNIGYSLTRPNRDQLELLEIFNMGEEGIAKSAERSLCSEMNKIAEASSSTVKSQSNKEEFLMGNPPRVNKGLALTPTNSQGASKISFNKKNEKPKIIESQEHYDWTQDNRRVSADSFNIATIESNTEKSLKDEGSVNGTESEGNEKAFSLADEGKSFHNYDIAAQPSNQPSQRTPREDEIKEKNSDEFGLPIVLKVEELIEFKHKEDELDSVIHKVKGVLLSHQQKEMAWKRERIDLLREVEMLRGRVKELEEFQYY